MNKKQKIIKKIAKRAKARQNKVDPATVGAPVKSGYVSKAERAKQEALEKAKVDEASTEQQSPNENVNTSAE